MVQRFRYIVACYYTIGEQSPPQGELVETYEEAFHQLEAICEDYETALWGRVVARWYPERNDPLKKEETVEETADASVTV